MAEIKVSQLTEASEINDNDLLMIVQNGENKKITKENCRFASGDEIYVGDTEPTGEDTESLKLWLTSDDALTGEGTYISNEYGTSQTIGYSQEYVNNALDDKQDKFIIEAITIGEDISFSGGDGKSYTVPDKTGYTAYVLKPYVSGNWSDKYAVYTPYNQANRFGIVNISGTTYTWSVYCAVLYVKNN